MNLALEMLAASVIIHERVANWSRQLRPRFPGWPVRWSETRSTAALVQAAARWACPILVIVLDRQPVRALSDFDQAIQVAPNALSMVLDPLDRQDVAAMARDLGATLVLNGLVVPPEVERLLQRWLPIARRRNLAEGWSAAIEPQPEAWEQEYPDLLEWTGQADLTVIQPDLNDRIQAQFPKDSV